MQCNPRFKISVMPSSKHKPGIFYMTHGLKRRLGFIPSHPRKSAITSHLVIFQQTANLDTPVRRNSSSLPSFLASTLVLHSHFLTRSLGISACARLDRQDTNIMDTWTPIQAQTYSNSSGRRRFALAPTCLPYFLPVGKKKSTLIHLAGWIPLLFEAFCRV
jgi:hypothetical protein